MNKNFFVMIVMMMLFIVPSVLAGDPFAGIKESVDNLKGSFTEMTHEISYFFYKIQIFFFELIFYILVFIYLVILYGLAILPVKVYINVYNNNQLLKKVLGESHSALSEQYRYFGTVGKTAINVTSKIVGGAARLIAGGVAGGIAGGKLASLAGGSVSRGVVGGVVHGSMMQTPAKTIIQPIYQARTGTNDIVEYKTVVQDRFNKQNVKNLDVARRQELQNIRDSTAGIRAFEKQKQINELQNKEYLKNHTYDDKYVNGEVVRVWRKKTQDEKNVDFMKSQFKEDLETKEVIGYYNPYHPRYKDNVRNAIRDKDLKETDYLKRPEDDVIKSLENDSKNVKSDKLSISFYDSKDESAYIRQLKKKNPKLYEGFVVEKEHNKSTFETVSIAKDHLKEDPNYYEKLKKAGL